MDIKNNLNKVLEIAHNELYDRVNSISYNTVYNEINDISCKTWQDLKGVNFYKDINNITDVFDATAFSNKSNNISALTMQNYVIEKFYDCSVKLDDRELNLDIENFTNEIIMPAIALLKQKIEDYYFTINNAIIIPNYQYENMIVKYDKNIGLGIDYQDNILSFRIVCGKLI